MHWFLFRSPKKFPSVLSTKMKVMIVPLVLKQTLLLIGNRTFCLTVLALSIFYTLLLPLSQSLKSCCSKETSSIPRSTVFSFSFPKKMKVCWEKYRSVWLSPESLGKSHLFNFATLSLFHYYNSHNNKSQAVISFIIRKAIKSRES